MQDIQQGKDQVYRWVYEMNLYTNPTILLMISKIFAGILLGIFIFLWLIAIVEDGFNLDDFCDLVVFFLYIGLGMQALAFVGYMVYAFLVGGKYCVLFEMDERGLKHTQLARQVRKAQIIGKLTFLAGAVTGNPTAMGTGLLAGVRSIVYSEFSRVKSIEVYRSRNVIKLNEPFNYNQVYVSDADFDFVLNFIQSRIHSKN